MYSAFLFTCNAVGTATCNEVFSFLFLFTSPQGLAMTPKVQESPFLHEIAMLGFGSMIDKYCAEHPSCPAELVRVCVSSTFGF